MKGIINLDNPLKVNNKSYGELTFDTNEITAQAFAEADASKMRASGSVRGNLSGAAELDYGLHLYLGFAAITAVNPEISMSDCERIKGSDVMKVMKIGRNFISGGSVDPSSPSNSDEQSETTLKTSALPSEISESVG